MTDVPLWRSMLFVPATAERFVQKAHTRGADAIIVDLEDSVAPSEKEHARTLLPKVTRVVGQGGADVVVRINRPLRMAVRDLEAAISSRVHAISIPKAESASHLRLLAEVIGELEAERGLPDGHTRLVALIETAEGYRNAAEIAASARMAGLTLGGEDFAHAMGMTSADAGLIGPWLRDVVLAARGAGILPLGYAGSIANFSDLRTYRDDIRAARTMGFEGGSCIHPAQVPVLNEEFGPSAEEVVQARRVVEAYDLALAEGRGAIELDGRMVDVPVADRARRVLAMADRIAERA